MTSLFRKGEHSKFAISTFSLFPSSPDAKENRRGEAGFSLIEVAFAMIVFLVAMLGVFITFIYAVSYNAGNNSRAQALTILQREVEILRSAKYTPTVRDLSLDGGTKSPKTVTSADLNKFIVQIAVDDDPFTDGVQTDTSKTIKEVSVTVTLDRPTPGWQTSVPAKVVLRRSRAN